MCYFLLLIIPGSSDLMLLLINRHSFVGADPCVRPMGKLADNGSTRGCSPTSVTERNIMNRHLLLLIAVFFLLVSLIDVTEDTVLNREKGRTFPSQQKVILLKERLNIAPFELTEFGGAISERQKSIINLTKERGQLQEENVRSCSDYDGSMRRTAYISYIDWEF